MKDVFKRICFAQIASDGGKGIYDLAMYAPKIWAKGYKAKDREIIRAIDLIRSGHGYNVKYSVAFDRFTRWGGTCYIVYFTWKDEAGSRRQVSFHSFNEKLYEYCDDSGIHTTRWDHKSSRQNVLDLLKGGDAL